MSEFYFSLSAFSCLLVDCMSLEKKKKTPFEMPTTTYSHEVSLSYGQLPSVTTILTG